MASKGSIGSFPLGKESIGYSEAGAASTPFDSVAKRYAVFSNGRIWNRTTFPVATPTESWRLSVGNIYSNNALSPPTGGGALLDYERSVARGIAHGLSRGMV